MQVQFLAAAAEGAAHGKGDLLTQMTTDPKWFIAYCMILFFGLLIWQGVHKFIFKALDDRAAGIAKELAEARRLREEAARLLGEYKAKEMLAAAEAQQIVADAKATADKMRADAARDLDAEMARREQLVEERIKRAEAQAAADIRGAAADAAIAAAEKLLRGGVDAAIQGRLVADAAQGLAKALR
jgi:F-type H+-transporting ATPase subunit b